MQLTQALRHADQRTARANALHHGVNHHTGGQLADNLRRQPVAVFIDVPFIIKLLRTIMIGQLTQPDRLSARFVHLKMADGPDLRPEAA